MIHSKFEERCSLFAAKEKEIRSRVAQSSYQAELEYLYASMPLSDAANYDFDIFEDYAAHGHFLRENVTWCRELPEELYQNQVLFHRVNDEEISACRSMFYQKLWPLVEGKTMEEAAKAINYWCLEEATYRLTDERTVSPLTVLHCAFGRCGEESTFAVTALRSVGIPARQVYAPKWPHCDDNHAWVEVFCDGKWQYLGACEPEESLNRGWFTAAASRAMLIHGRTFGSVPLQEELISRDGCMSLWNQLPRYADCKTLTITVEENGQPLEGVLVKCELLNYAEFAAIARQLTDSAGKVKLTVGLGDLHLHCVKDRRFITTKIDLRNEQDIRIDFSEAELCETEDRNGTDFEMQPPVDNMAFLHPQSEEITHLHQQKFDAATKKRHAKETAYMTAEQGKQLLLKYGFNEDRAERGAVLLAGTYGNEKTLLTFLQGEEKEIRLALLECLSEKDRYDCSLAVLEEAFERSMPYQKNCPEKLFVPYLMNPRIGREVLTCWREELASRFTEEEKEKFRQDPCRIGQWIRKTIQYHLDQEYSELLTVPLGVMDLKSGSQRSQYILFVAICRSLGIPARLAPDDQRPQYWNQTTGCFEDGMPQKSEDRWTFLLCTEEEEPWLYAQTWSLARLEQGEYVTLDLSAERWSEGKLELQLLAGYYRLITCKRMPTGSLFAKEYRFTVGAGQENRLQIRQRQARLVDLLSDKPIPNFHLYEADGSMVSMEEICSDQSNLLLWLEEGKEPTEHILNEMEELREGFSKLEGNIIFVLKSKSALNDARISRALDHIPGIRILYDDFRDTMSLLARRMYIDPDKLPIVVLCSRGLNAIYGSSGYNVGLGDLILKIVAELK